MRGQIIEKSKGVWLVRIESNKDGKRTSFSKQIRGNKKDAETFLTAKLSETDRGVFVQPSKQTLKSYLEQWLNTVAKVNVSEETFANYKWFIDKRISPRIGGLRLTDLRKSDVQHFYNQMTADGIGARMVRLCHSILHSALTEAVRLNLLAINPASKSKLPKWTRKEISVLTPEQAKAFREAAQNNSNGCVLIFALETGMRPEEYLALKWSDIDFEGAKAIVQRSLKRRKKADELKTWYFGETKTKKSRRTVPLSSSLIKMLKAYRLEQNKRRLKLGALYENHDLVFASEFGAPVHIENLRNRNFQKVLEKIGLSNALRLYDLRHSCATLLLLAGENPKVVSERLGHSSVTMTLDTYSHVLPNMQKTATERLEVMLFG